MFNFPLNLTKNTLKEGKKSNAKKPLVKECVLTKENKTKSTERISGNH